LQTLVRDNAIKSELAKLNPLDDARDAIELLAGQFIRTKMVDGKVTVEVLGANGAPRVKDHLGTPVSIADLLTEIRDTKPALFKPEEKRGLGTTPGSNGSPPANGSQPNRGSRRPTT